jgi:hypothetical protein
VSSQVVTLAAGATEADIQSALNSLPDGGRLVLAANQTISISHGLTMDVTSRSITLDLNGSTLQQAGDVTVLTVKGGHAAGQGATLGHDAAGEVTMTTAGAAPAAAVGDWVKVYSDDVLPNDQGTATRMGQAMQVEAVSGNTLTLKGTLVDEASYTDNIRVSGYVGGTPTVENGTVRGDQRHPTWEKDLVQLRSTVEADLNHLTVRDGNSMGINVVDSVDARITQSAVINLTDDPANGHDGYGVHSASSFGTTVDGLYADHVRHSTDDNAVGTAAGTVDPSKYGADIGMTVSDVVANGTTSPAFSWHTEGRGGTISDSVVFNSYGVLGARGLDNSMADVAGANNARGIQFYEYGDGDGRHIGVDNVQLTGLSYYAYTSIGNTADDTVSHSTFETTDKKAWIATGITVTDSSTTVLPWGAPVSAVSLAGTAAADRLLGTALADTISGGGGDDYIWGGNGADLLNGGGGHDRFAYLSTIEGGDTISGFTTGKYGDAIDLSVIAIQHHWQGDLFAGGYVSLVQSGADTLVRVDANGGGDDYVTLATLKNVNAAAARANISTEIHVTGHDTGVTSPTGEQAPAPVYPDALKLTVAGTLNGTSGGDLMIGTDGNDELVGNDGDDTLIGGAGQDTLVGGTGSNMASYVTVDAGLIVDLQTPALNTGDATGDSYSQIASLRGSAYDDQLLGNSGANTLQGGAGDDLLDGRDGADSLSGGPGDDWLTGGAGSDRLSGDAGNDTLVGGTGYDTLTGGDGSDVFQFDAADKNWDIITDFQPGEDHIALANFGITRLDATDFVASADPHAVAAVGTVLYNSSDGSLWWDADGTGSGAAVKVASLTGHPDLQASDLLFS